MGIVLLVVFAVGLYIIGRALFRAVAGLFKTRPAVATEATQSVQSEVSGEVDWAALEVPTFVRRGLPFPVLTKKVKAKRVRKPKVALNPDVASFPVGDWTLFAKFEGENHATY
jgi:hypothetical protein